MPISIKVNGVARTVDADRHRRVEAAGVNRELPRYLHCACGFAAHQLGPASPILMEGGKGVKVLTSKAALIFSILRGC